MQENGAKKSSAVSFPECEICRRHSKSAQNLDVSLIFKVLLDLFKQMAFIKTKEERIVENVW